MGIYGFIGDRGMKGKYRFVAALLLVVLAGAGIFVRLYGNGTPAAKDGKLKVVTSFYPVYIAAANVAGDCEGIEVLNLSEPQTGCLHDFVLTPEDMQMLSRADLFLINGGGMETFLEEVASQYPSLAVVETAEGLLDGENAHVWMGIARYRAQVSAVLDALVRMAGAYQDELKANAAAYDAKLAGLQEQQEELKDAIAGGKIISFHEAYEYLAADYGLEIAVTLDLDEERQVGAGEVTEVINAIKTDGADVILAEALYGREMAETIQKEADVKVCFLDTLVRGDDSLDSYINGMQENINILRKAFLPSGELEKEGITS